MNSSESKILSEKETARELAGYFEVFRRRLLLAIRDNPVTNQAISVHEAHALFSLGMKDNLTMSEIADTLCLSLSSVTAIVDKLEAKKCVRRERIDKDRRIVRVALTGQGRKFYDMVEKAHLTLTTDILETLNRGEQDELLRLFRKIVAQFRPA